MSESEMTSEHAMSSGAECIEHKCHGGPGSPCIHDPLGLGPACASTPPARSEVEGLCPCGSALPCRPDSLADVERWADEHRRAYGAQAVANGRLAAEKSRAWMDAVQRAESAEAALRSLSVQPEVETKWLVECRLKKNPIKRALDSTIIDGWWLVAVSKVTGFCPHCKQSIFGKNAYSEHRI